jgi:two-component sensor histidine kinase
LTLNWRERVKAMPPRTERRGFGTTVLENMVGSSLSAEVERTLHQDGIEWRFAIPLASLDPESRGSGGDPESM